MRRTLVTTLFLGVVLAAATAYAGEAPAPPAEGAPAAEPPAAKSPEAPSEPWKAPEPPAENRPAYFAHLLQVIPGALEKSTCHCCAKSLARCYLDMPDPTVKGKCPFG